MSRMLTVIHYGKALFWPFLDVLNMSSDLRWQFLSLDIGMINALYATLSGEKNAADTSLENSIESHIMAIAAEDSRVSDGKVVLLKDYR